MARERHPRRPQKPLAYAAVAALCIAIAAASVWSLAGCVPPPDVGGAGGVSRTFNHQGSRLLWTLPGVGHSPGLHLEDLTPSRPDDASSHLTIVCDERGLTVLAWRFAPAVYATSTASGSPFLVEAGFELQGRVERDAFSGVPASTFAVSQEDLRKFAEARTIEASVGDQAFTYPLPPRRFLASFVRRCEADYRHFMPAPAAG